MGNANQKKVVRARGRFNIAAIYEAGWGELNSSDSRAVYARIQEGSSLDAAIQAFASKGIVVEFVGPIRCSAAEIKKALAEFHFREVNHDRRAVLREIIEDHRLSGVEEQILRNACHTPEVY